MKATPTAGFVLFVDGQRTGGLFSSLDQAKQAAQAHAGKVLRIEGYSQPPGPVAAWRFDGELQQWVGTQPP